MSKNKVKEIKGLKRGYKAVIKNKKFNFGDGKHIYEVIELSGPKMDKVRYFVDEESVKQFVFGIEGISKQVKFEANLIKGLISKKQKKDMTASNDIADMSGDLVTAVNAHIRDEKAKRPVDTDR